MNDDNIIKVMQSLGLDYNPAIDSTLKFGKSIDDVNKQLADMKVKAIRNAKDINNAFTSQLGQINNKQIVDQWSRPIKYMQKEVSQTATTMAKMATSHESVAATIEKYRVPIGELVGEYNLLGTKVDDTNQFFTANAAQLYAISKAAKEATGTIKDVEMGMVEIQRVMDDTSFVFTEYRDNLLGLGVDYGQTFDTVQNIALRWAQSGYNVADSLKLTESSLLALNAGELDAKNATESMIGIMAQWQLEAEDLELLMDKIGKTADSYSTTAQDLVDGLLRSSGAAKTMNMSIEETLSLLTLMRESSGRTGKEVGNALNSIISYIQRPKSIETMEDMGIEVFADKAKTQFRNVLEIFQDIAANWDKTSKEIQDGFVAAADDADLFNEELATALGMQEKWNDLQKRDMSQAAAGVHRRNFFIGMIERMTDVQGVLNNMMDAEGYIMEKNALAMDTLEKKQQSLKASIEVLAVAAGDAGLGGSLKLLTDGGIKALDMFNKVPKGARETILVMTELTLVVKALEAGMGLLSLKMPIASAGINILTGGMANLTTNTMAFATALKTGLVANLPLLGSAAVIGGIVALKNHMQRAREEAEKFIATTQDNIKSLDEQKQGLTELSNEYKTLKAKEQNLTATVEEKERLKEIQRELVEQYGVSITGIDAEGKAYADSVEDIKTRIKALEELREIENKRLESAIIETRDGDIKDIEESLRQRKVLEQELIKTHQKIKGIDEDYRNRQNLYLGMFQITPEHREYDDRVEAYIEKLKKYALDIEIAIDDTNTAIKNSASDTKQYLTEYANIILSEFEKSGKTASDSARVFANELAEGLTMTSKGALEVKNEFETVFKDFLELDADYKRAVSKSDTTAIDDISKAIKDFVNDIAEGQPELENLITLMEKIYPNAENLTKAVDDTTKSTIDSSKAIEKATKAYEDATTKLKEYYIILNELNSKEGLSAQSKDAIIMKYHDLLPYLSDTKELRKRLIEIIKEEEKTQREAYNAMLVQSEDFYISRIKGNSELVKSLNEYYDTDFKNFKSLADAKGKVEAELVSQLSGIWAEYYGVVKRGNVNAMIGLEQQAMQGSKDAQQVLDAHRKIAEMESHFRNISLDLGGIDFKEINTSGIKDSKTKKEKYENKALEEALKLLEHRKRISEETQDSIKAEIAELNRINSLYVKTADERMNLAERIYAAEKRLKDKRLQDSVNWINEKKNLDELSTEREIYLWEKVKRTQSNNIEAIKQAELNLYKLKNQLRTENLNKEESTIKHLTKLGVYSVQQQIDAYKNLYSIKANSLDEERNRVENLFSLYKSLLAEQQRKIKDAYDDRIRQIESEANAKKAMQDDVIRGIEAELKLLDRQEQAYDHDKKMADLKEQLAYWQVRTSEDARKKVAELLKQIDEAEHDREIELKKQGLEDKKQIAQDEVKAIDEAAKRERENWERSYKLVERAFDDHSTSIVALAATMSKEAYMEWENNYLIPLQNALFAADFGSFDFLVGGLENSLNDFSSSFNDIDSNWGTSSTNHDWGMSDADYKRFKENGWRWAELQAQGYKQSVNAEMQRLNAENDALRVEYGRDPALGEKPKFHQGAKTLSYGVAEFMPGELVFPPDLSIKLEGLIGALYKRPISQSSNVSNINDRRIVNNFNAPLYNSEKTIFEDDIDGEILSRQLQRQLTSII